MKQFQYTSYRDGSTGPVCDFKVAAGSLEDADVVFLAGLAEGQKLLLRKGHWTRVQDRQELKAPATDERLERIALEYLRILLPAHLGGLSFKDGETVSTVCVSSARDFIAELDATK